MTTKKKTITMKFFKLRRKPNKEIGPDYCINSAKVEFTDAAELIKQKEYMELAIIGLKLHFFKDTNPKRKDRKSLLRKDLEPTLPWWINDGDIIFLLPEKDDGDPDLPTVWTNIPDPQLILPSWAKVE